LRLFSFGGYGLALAALALVVFGAIECPPVKMTCETDGDIHIAVSIRKASTVPQYTKIRSSRKSKGGEQENSTRSSFFVRRRKKKALKLLKKYLQFSFVNDLRRHDSNFFFQREI